MADDFKYDVFLSHSSKDREVVYPVAEGLRADGLRVWFGEWEIRIGDNISAKIEEGLEHSRVLVLCMSANAFGSEWAELEDGTFRFRDPLNKERRFVVLRLDSAPIKGSLAQCSYINWLPGDRRQEYAELLQACRPLGKPPTEQAAAAVAQVAEKVILLEYKDANLLSFDFSLDGRRVLFGSDDNVVRLWELETGRCVRVLEGHTGYVVNVVWSADQRHALSVGGSDKTLRLWDVETGHCLRVLEGHTEYIWASRGAAINDTPFPVQTTRLCGCGT